MEHEADEEEKLISMDFIIDTSIGEGMTEGQLWYELDMELHRQEDAVSQACEEEAAAAKEITGEENVVMLDANVGPGPLLGSILDQTRPWL